MLMKISYVPICSSFLRIYLCMYNVLYMCTYVCEYVIIHKLNVRTIFVPQVVPEAAGVPILKHEFPVFDVPQRKTLHTSYNFISK